MYNIFSNIYNYNCGERAEGQNTTEKDLVLDNNSVNIFY